MKSTFHSVDVLFRLPLFTVLGLAIFLGGCNYTYSQSYEIGSSSTELNASSEFKRTSPLNSKRLRESSEFKWTSPPSSKKYNGPQNAPELMKVFDGDYNSGHLKTEVSAFRKVAGVKIANYSSKLTMREIDARYPRAEWLQMLLDRGITIKNFNDYSKYLLKRHTLALLEDNPKLRQSEILDIPPTNDWETYKEAYIDKLVNDHAKTWETVKQIERSKKEVERAKTQIERSIEQLERVQKEMNSRQLEHAKKEAERAKAQIERAQKTLERTKKSASPPHGSDR